MKTQTPAQEPQTTGHVWDETLQEFNNPLPNWWLWTFYLTIIIAIIYWVFYPSWPVGRGFLKGVDTITYTNAQGQQQTSSWNTRALLAKDMNDAAIKQKPFFDKIAALPYDQIKKDNEAKNFVASAGKVLWADNCAACHQSGGQGKVGAYPNLTDDDWLYGGSFEKIEESITKGRRGMMPAKGGNASLTDAQVTELAHFILSLSGEKVDGAKAQAGDQVFHSTGACFACHGADAKGNQALGAPNLTDKIWLWADVAGQNSLDGKVAALKKVITEGVDRGVMPAWGGRLTPQQIKVLTVYVHEFGGGK
jgi:cytochrome c oxidase cbb3-type subunit 3